MEPMIYIMPFIGLILGVCVNLLADSLPGSRSIRKSACYGCGAPRPHLAWSAVLAWLTRHWHCAYCGRGRGLRSVLVEITASIGLTILASLNADPVYLFRTTMVGFVFLLILVIDMEHRLILHIVTLPAGILFLVFAGITPDLSYARSLLGGAFGFILFMILYLLGDLFGRWIARRRGAEYEEVAFGFGDVTLATVIGLLLGFPAVIEALIRGILYAGIFSILYMLVSSLRKRYSAFTAIPYGPFLILGALWVYFQGWTSLERLVGM